MESPEQQRREAAVPAPPSWCSIQQQASSDRSANAAPNSLARQSVGLPHTVRPPDWVTRASGWWEVVATDAGPPVRERILLDVRADGTIAQTEGCCIRGAGSTTPVSFHICGHMSTQTALLSFSQTYTDGVVTQWNATYDWSTDCLVDGRWTGECEGTFRATRECARSARGRRNSTQLEACCDSRADTVEINAQPVGAASAVRPDSLQSISELATWLAHHPQRVHPTHEHMRPILDAAASAVPAASTCDMDTVEWPPSASEFTRPSCRSSAAPQPDKIDEVDEDQPMVSVEPKRTSSAGTRVCGQHTPMDTVAPSDLGRRIEAEQLAAALAASSESYAAAAATGTPPARNRQSLQPTCSTIDLSTAQHSCDAPPWVDALEQVMAVTGAPRQDASHFLEATGGDANAAVSLFLDSMMQTAAPRGGAHAPPPAAQPPQSQAPAAAAATGGSAAGQSEAAPSLGGGGGTTDGVISYIQQLDGDRRAQLLQQLGVQDAGPAAAAVAPTTSTTRLPEFWDAIPAGRQMSLVSLNDFDHPAEMAHIAEHFELTCPSSSGFEILSMQRLQHLTRWRQFDLQKESMELRGDGVGANLKWLWHGTADATVELICKNGFDRSFTHTEAYGHGVYFASEARYSAHVRFSPPDREGVQSMFLAQVLVGHSCRGARAMRHPPARSVLVQNGETLSGLNEQVPYDSLVDNLERPKIFVSCHNDNQAYPQYLVRFRRTMGRSGRVAPAASTSTAAAPYTGAILRVWNNGSRCVTVKGVHGRNKTLATVYPQEDWGAPVHAGVLYTFHTPGVSGTVHVIGSWTTTTAQAQHIIIDTSTSSSTEHTAAVIASDKPEHRTDQIRALIQRADQHSGIDRSRQIATACDGTPLLGRDGAVISQRWPPFLAAQLQAHYPASIQPQFLGIRIKFLNQLGQTVVVSCADQVPGTSAHQVPGSATMAQSAVVPTVRTVLPGQEIVVDAEVGQIWKAILDDAGGYLVGLWDVQAQPMKQQAWETAARAEHACFVICGNLGFGLTETS
eukprot:COSAG01_NODE_1540_length_9985_cov_7.634855_1_plen_1022_part_00